MKTEKILVTNSIIEKMTSAKMADRKAMLDTASWMFNVVTSVGIILVNKALMAKYGFTFGMSLVIILIQ
jgi:hypothetical protein